MNGERKGPDALEVLGGIALVLCGLCLLLVGGGCTILWVAAILDSRGSWESGGLGLFAVSVAVAALGVAACYKGVRMMMGK